MKKSYLLIAVAIIIFLAALGGTYWFIFLKSATTSKSPEIRPLSLKSPSPAPANTASPEPTKTPKPIPSGRQEFIVGSSKKTGPQMSSGYIDPYDPEQGQAQILSINIASDQPVTGVTLTMESDNKSRDIPMERKEGTDTNGRWEGVWTVDDTYLYTYVATIKAASSAGTNTVDITLR